MHNKSKITKFTCNNGCNKFKIANSFSIERVEKKKHPALALKGKYNFTCWGRFRTMLCTTIKKLIKFIKNYKHMHSCADFGQNGT